MNNQTPVPNKAEQQKIFKWIDESIFHLQGDKFIIESDVASPETHNLYSALASGNTKEIIDSLYSSANPIIFRNMIVSFMTHFTQHQVSVDSLAFSLAGHKVFIWAEIKEGDDEAENALIIAEAKANAEFYNLGFNISSTIVEDCDKLKVPSHYIVIPKDKMIAGWQTI